MKNEIIKIIENIEKIGFKSKVKASLSKSNKNICHIFYFVYKNTSYYLNIDEEKNGYKISLTYDDIDKIYILKRNSCKKEVEYFNIDLKEEFKYIYRKHKIDKLLKDNI